MAYDIGVKLKIDGEKAYRDAINEINLVNKTLDTELKAVTSSFTKNTTAQEKATAQEGILQKQLENSKKKLAEVSKGLADAQSKYSENSKEVQSWKQALNNAQTEVNKITNKIEELTDAEKDGTKQSSMFGDVLKANLTSDAIIGGIKAVAGAIKEVGGAILDTVKASRQFADDINTLSKTTGLSTDTLQEFQYMSKLIDVDLNTITGSLKKLTTNMNSAKGGSKTTADAFKKLGVQITNTDGSLRKNQEVFYEVIDALGKIENETERDAVAMSLFGKSATDLNPLILAGADALNELSVEAYETGYVLNTDTLDALNSVQDNFDRLDNAVTVVKNQIGSQFAPVVAEITQKFIDWANSVDWTTVGNVITTVVNAIGTVILWLIETVVHIITEFVEFGQECQNLYNIIKDAIGKIPQVFENLKTSITTTFQNLIASARAWGSDMIEGFKQGIEDKLGALKRKVEEMAGSIRARIHFSRPDTGPLRDYEKWMPDFMQGLANGIKQNSYLVENAMSSVANGMVLNPQAGNSARSGIVINMGGVTFNGYTSKQGNDLVADLNRQLGRLYG